MKKLSLLLMTMFFMVWAIPSGFAQEITISLVPGWNWISYPKPEVMDIVTALGDFTPEQGDIIKSRTNTATYNGTTWRGSMQLFTTGTGYHYYSNRTETVNLVFGIGVPEVNVTTTEPTDITITSAVCGGTVTAGEGSHVFARGLCWDTSPNPVYDDNHTSDSTIMGSLSNTLEGLCSNTTYYVRAYVVSDSGLSYGNEVSFSTLEGGGSGNVPIGAINGLFTINANGDQVYFSQGNLQYQASTNTWRFAENQWDYVGNSYNGTVYEGEIKCNNGLISEYYTGWIDLYGWGTSGWDNGNAYYQPYDTERFSVNGDGYGPTNGYNYNYNLTGIFANADWGVYNAISNGGNMPNQWYTLTSSGWNYIINNRSTQSGIRYSKAKVNGVDGLIILPDNWDTSIYTLNCPNQADATCSSNEIGLSDWVIMETNGAVFLPNAGIRQQTSVYFTNACGSYWSSTCYGENKAHFLQSSNPSLGGTSTEYRYLGFSVRLVRLVE